MSNNYTLGENDESLLAHPWVALLPPPFQKKTTQINRHPLHQWAKKTLVSLKTNPRPTTLYLPQLMEWGLESPLAEEMNPAEKRVMEDQLQEMMADNPEEVHHLLMGQAPTTIPKEELALMSPMEGVQKSLILLEETLKEQEILPAIQSQYLTLQ